MGDLKLCVAVVGATGAVGEEMLKVLENREFPVYELRAFASPKSTGKTLRFHHRSVAVRPLSAGCFRGVDLALFSAGSAVSEQWAPEAASEGALVVDNTSCFRMQPEVPLVVPEVNPHELEQWPNKGIIANPNCSTIQMVVVLKPLHDRYGINRVVVATYQAVSGAGRSAMEELSGQVISLYNNRPVEVSRFPKQIAFNCIPMIGPLSDHGYAEEELKLMRETRRILGEEEIRVTATAVRVPVFHGHAEAVWVETLQKPDLNEVTELLQRFPGVKVVDEPDSSVFPTQLDAAGGDSVLVGRIRIDDSVPNGLALWVVADNLRKGAALNAVQIAEVALNKGLFDKKRG